MPRPWTAYFICAAPLLFGGFVLGLPYSALLFGGFVLGLLYRWWKPASRLRT